jgi:hypothetical protein
MEMTMTDERMALIERIEKQADSDLVRAMLAFAADRIMDLEVELRTGAAKGDLVSLIRTGVVLAAQGWRDHDDADALRHDPACGWRPVPRRGSPHSGGGGWPRNRRCRGLPR